MQKKAMNLIGEDQLLEWNALLSERPGERHGLRKGDITIVVALDEQDRRAPGSNGGHGRRLPGRFHGLRVGIRVMRRPPVCGPLPLMNSVHVHARGEDIGGAGKSQCREITSVASSPCADLCRVDVGSAAEVVSSAKNVVVFAGS